MFSPECWSTKNRVIVYDMGILAMCSQTLAVHVTPMFHLYIFVMRLLWSLYWASRLHSTHNVKYGAEMFMIFWKKTSMPLPVWKVNSNELKFCIKQITVLNKFIFVSIHILRLWSMWGGLETVWREMLPLLLRYEIVAWCFGGLYQ